MNDLYMENIEKIRQAQALVERYDKIVELEKKLSQSGKLEGLLFPGHTALDKDSRVDIPYFLRDVLKKAIRNCLSECKALELGGIEQIRIEGTRDPKILQ